MADIEFIAWPKTTRLFRDIVITEKIDGTNAAIIITDDGQVGAQSRNHLLTREGDNHGFCNWVLDNADALVELLGRGRHFGEWWGKGVGRKYDRQDRSFSLFNTAQWGTMVPTRLDDARIDCVPVLYEGVFDQLIIEEQLRSLREYGSMAAPGFMDPEGVCIYHTQTRVVQKVTLDNNDKGKWESNG